MRFCGLKLVMTLKNSGKIHQLSVFLLTFLQQSQDCDADMYNRTCFLKNVLLDICFYIFLQKIFMSIYVSGFLLLFHSFKIDFFVILVIV